MAAEILVGPDRGQQRPVGSRKRPRTWSPGRDAGSNPAGSVFSPYPACTGRHRCWATWLYNASSRARTRLTEPSSRLMPPSRCSWYPSLSSGSASPVSRSAKARNPAAFAAMVISPAEPYTLILGSSMRSRYSGHLRAHPYSHPHPNPGSRGRSRWPRRPAEGHPGCSASPQISGRRHTFRGECTMQCPRCGGGAQQGPDGSWLCPQRGPIAGLIAGRSRWRLRRSG